MVAGKAHTVTGIPIWCYYNPCCQHVRSNIISTLTKGGSNSLERIRTTEKNQWKVNAPTGVPYGLLRAQYDENGKIFCLAISCSTTLVSKNSEHENKVLPLEFAYVVATRLPNAEAATKTGRPRAAKEPWPKT